MGCIVDSTCQLSTYLHHLSDHPSSGSLWSSLSPFISKLHWVAVSCLLWMECLLTLVKWEYCLCHVWCNIWTQLTYWGLWLLTHWGRATHKLTIIGTDNGLSPGRRQAIIWTSAGILLIGPLGTNFNEIFIEIHTFSFKKIHLKMSSGKWRPFCLGLNVDEMAAISQMKFTDAFLWMKSFVFWLKFHWTCWSLFLRVQLTIYQHWFRWLGTK